MADNTQTAGEPLDLARVQPLAAKLLKAVKPELAREPPGNDNIFTVLNALAIPAALIIAGTGFDPAAIEFFRRALARQVVAQGIPVGDAPAWLWLTAPDDERPPDAEWIDEAGGQRLALMATYYDDPCRVFNALSLTDAVVEEAEVLRWTSDQRRAAAEWALSVHFAASDNDDVIVPPRPDFIPLKPAGAP